MNFGPISFGPSFVNFGATGLCSVMFFGGFNLLKSFVLNGDESVFWLFFGLAVCYFSGGYLFWLYGRTMYVFRNEITIKNPYWFKNYRFHGDEVKEYGILVEKTSKGKFVSWMIVLKDREPINLVPDFYGDFDVLLQFLKDNHVPYARTRPFNDYLTKQKTMKQKVEEYQIIAAVIFFFIIGAWWLKLSLQL